MITLYNPTELPPSNTYGATSSNNVDEVQLNYGEPPPAGWDYVLVFRAPASTTEDISTKQRLIDTARIAVLNDIKAASFAYSQLWVPSTRVILVRLALSEHDMMQKAELAGIKLRTRPEYSGGYLPFTRANAYTFENYRRREQELPYFTPAERVYITQVALRSREDWGADINFADLFRDGLLKDVFALHSQKERKALIRAAVYDSWWNPFRGLPLYALNEYFGPRVTLYLAWVLFFTRMLSGFAILSVPVYLIIVYSPWPLLSAGARVAFGIAISFWSSYWIRYWLRRNAVLNVRWGLTDAADDQENMLRDDFHGVETPGFYSRGGFVHLSDLVASHGSHSRSNLNEDSNVSQHHQQQPMSRSESTTLTSEDYVIDDPQNETVDTTNDLTHLQSERVTLAALVRNEQPEMEQVIMIGNANDSDFSLEAPITGRTFDDLPMYPYCSRQLVWFRKRLSALTTLIFATVVAFLSLGILYFRSELNALVGVDSGSGIVSGIATAVLIIIADNLWRTVSTKLTEWENHHTSQDFEDSLISKRFAFQFVSNYITLFYIAFAKPFLPNDPCILNYSDIPDCMLELETQLLSVVISKATIEQIFELGIPLLLSLFRRVIRLPGQQRLRSTLLTDEEERERLLERGAVVDEKLLYLGPLRQHEEVDDVQVLLDELKRMPYEDTIDDYSEVIIQYGFLVLFGVAFPLAALINLVNNVMEFRMDTYKILAIHRRPSVDIATSIGSWLQVIRLLSTLSIVTTIALLTITTPALQQLLQLILPTSVGQAAIDYPLVSFVIAEHLLLFVRWAVSALITDVPGSTYRLKARRSFLMARCLNVGWKPYFRSRRSNQSRFQRSLQM